MKQLKCKECNKLIRREAKHIKNVGYFHPACYDKRLKKDLEKQADALWRIAVFNKWGYYCAFCAHEAYCAHHHFRKGNHPELRYEINNGIPICRECHAKIHNSDPKVMEADIKQQRGANWEHNLIKKAREKCHKTRTIHYYKEIIKSLKV